MVQHASGSVPSVFRPSDCAKVSGHEARLTPTERGPFRIVTLAVLHSLHSHLDICPSWCTRLLYDACAFIYCHCHYRPPGEPQHSKLPVTRAFLY